MPLLRAREIAHAALIVALALWALPALAQIDGEHYAPGAACPTGATPGHAVTPDWDTFFECNGSNQMQRGPYFFGASGDTCDSNHAGMVQWTGSSVSPNTTLEYCDGSNWDTIGSTLSACGTPSGLSFTNLTNATLNTVYTSNAATITFSGCTQPYSVSVTGASSAQISVNGGAWSTSGAIYSGQTLKVRLTSSSSISTMLTATVTVGSSSTNWTVTTSPGALIVFETGSLYSSGGLGGLSGADTVCQNEASVWGYPGTFKAIMSDDSTSAASRLTLSYPIVNAYDGSTVAASNLWAGSIQSPIEQPWGYSSNQWAWTGSNGDGTSAVGQTCSSWTSDSGSGTSGSPDFYYDGQWIGGTAWGCGGGFTANGEFLYCIQQ